MTKKRSRKKKMVSAVKSKTAKAKRVRALRAKKETTKKPSGIRVPKIYRLVGDIPETIRKASAGLAILKAIQKRESASVKELQSDLGKNFSAPTLRFFLGKFQRDKIVSAK